MEGRKLEESLCVSFTQKAKDPVVTGCERMRVRDLTKSEGAGPVSSSFVAFDQRP